MRDMNLPAELANDTEAPAWDISINYIPILFGNDYEPAIIKMKPNERQVRLHILTRRLSLQYSSFARNLQPVDQQPVFAVVQVQVLL